MNKIKLQRSHNGSVSLRGFTLVEVLAALALLGTVITSIILVRSRLMVQVQRIEQQREACRMAESLIAQWRAYQADWTIPIEGTWHDGWVWWRKVDSNSESQLFQTVHLCFFADTPGEPLIAYTWMVAPNEAVVTKNQ